MWRLAFFSMTTTTMMVKEIGMENKRDVNITPVLEICTMIYNQRQLPYFRDNWREILNNF